MHSFIIYWTDYRSLWLSVWLSGGLTNRQETFFVECVWGTDKQQLILCVEEWPGLPSQQGYSANEDSLVEVDSIETVAVLLTAAAR